VVGRPVCPVALVIRKRRSLFIMLFVSFVIRGVRR
jgi:hypothetical protein